MDDFYYNIHIRKGNFSIKKDDEWFLSFDNIYDALAHRDKLIECDWDWDLYLQYDVDSSKYMDMDLPPFREDDLQYITKEKNHRGKKPYVIKKKINGKLRRFGRYQKIEDAIRMRDKLIENNWEDFKKLKRELRESIWQVD